jgi:phosphatidylserine/phosphatidylglycerophosphate/cardiolipin synthase-like enzyme
MQKRSLFILVAVLGISFNTYAATPLNSGASFDIGFSPDGDSLELVLKGINSAKKSIYVAAYSFTSKPISSALLSAYKRGVDVKVVADAKSNSGKYSATTYLANNNVPVKLDSNYAIFHHKFIIIDGQTLETGSFNFSKNAATKNAENVLLLWNVPQIAQVYYSEWQKLWNESYLLKSNY